MATHEERISRLETLMEKNTEAIKDLIVVARTGLEATMKLQEGVQEGMAALHEELSTYAKAAEERSREQDGRINALIHVVDELIRRNGHDGEERKQ